MNCNEEVTRVIWVGLVWVFSHLNTKPSLWLESDAEGESEVRNGWHLAPLVCCCRGQMESRSRRWNVDSSWQQRADAEMVQNEGCVLQTRRNRTPWTTWMFLKDSSSQLQWGKGFRRGRDGNREIGTQRKNEIERCYKPEKVLLKL